MGMQRAQPHKTVSLCLILLFALPLLAGCSSSTEKPKAEGGGTYYEGPLHNKGKKSAN